MITPSRPHRFQLAAPRSGAPVGIQGPRGERSGDIYGVAQGLAHASNRHEQPDASFLAQSQGAGPALRRDSPIAPRLGKPRHADPVGPFECPVPGMTSVQVSWREPRKGNFECFSALGEGWETSPGPRAPFFLREIAGALSSVCLTNQADLCLGGVEMRHPGWPSENPGQSVASPGR